MSVHPTPALTAIDLDLATATATRATKSRTHDQANRAALPALARQIRLRLADHLTARDTAADRQPLRQLPALGRHRL